MVLPIKSHPSQINNFLKRRWPLGTGTQTQHPIVAGRSWTTCPMADSESRTLLKTIRTFTRPIVTWRLDGPKRCMWTQAVGMPIIRVAHKAMDLDVAAVPVACPMRWSVEGCHGRSRTTTQASWPGLAHGPVSPRCPRTAINNQRLPPAATCEHEARAGSEPASNAREHSRYV
jgi:hypothetical protein